MNLGTFIGLTGKEPKTPSFPQGLEQSSEIQFSELFTFAHKPKSLWESLAYFTLVFYNKQPLRYGNILKPYLKK